MDLSVLWQQIDEERRAKIETAVEQMVADEQQRGVLIIESQYGVILSAELSEDVPFGTVLLKRKVVHNGLDGLVPPSTESG